jgi:hypothetical protein
MKMFSIAAKHVSKPATVVSSAATFVTKATQ